MKILGLALACLIVGAAHARPVIVEERARFSNPDPSYPVFARALAIDGDFAIVAAHRDNPETDSSPSPTRDFAALLFRRTASGWTFVRTLLTEQHDEFELFDYGVSMDGGVAAIATTMMHIYELRAGDWVHAGSLPGEPGADVEVDDGRIFHGGTSGTWAGLLYERDTNGIWQRTQTLFGAIRSGDDEFSGGPVDLSGDHAVVGNPYSDEPLVRTPSISVFVESGGDWVVADTIEPPAGTDPYGPESFSSEVALRGTDIVIGGSVRTGSWLFRPDPESGLWVDRGRLQPLNSYMGGGPSFSIKKSDEHVMQLNLDPDRDVTVINVFAPDAQLAYQHAAVLRASHGDSLGDFDISGSRVIAGCGGEVCEFQLPAPLRAPPPRQHTFTLAAADFTTSAGSRFAIAQGQASRVFRQTDTAPGLTHAAVFEATNWTNQSIQADVRPLIFNGADRWVGLATRYRDAGNHYYVTLRSSGSVQLKRMVDGAFATLASAPLTVSPYRTYRVRLESTGSNHRVFVDGELLLDVDDEALASGRTALLTYATRAQFDNVFASPSPLTTIYADDFDPCCFDLPWRHSGGGLWIHTQRAADGVFAQASVEGAARAFIGVQTDDQVVEARARPNTFASGGSTQDRWFGLITRYRDVGNYYYVSVRSSNSISLRKLSNGVIHDLRTAPLPVPLGQWRTLRLEALGQRLRVYVDGNLVLEASDAEHTQGVSGLMTWRTAADFDDFRVIQP